MPQFLLVIASYLAIAKDLYFQRHMRQQQFVSTKFGVSKLRFPTI
jgi:hypothetical protein